MKIIENQNLQNSQKLSKFLTEILTFSWLRQQTELTTTFSSRPTRDRGPCRHLDRS